jgi:hypothetical protein
MISPLFILKKIRNDYKDKWKELFTLSFALSLTGVLASLLYFIQIEMSGNLNYNYIYTLAYIILSFNAFFIFINFIKFLYKNKKQSYLEIFANFKIKITVNLILISIVLFTIFSCCFTFPLLIFPTINSLIVSEALALLLIVTTIILGLIGISLFTLLSFSPIIAITGKEYKLTIILQSSYQIVRKSFFQVFGHKLLITTFNLGMTSLTYILFIKFAPLEWFIRIEETGITPIGFTISYLLLSLLVYTIVIFVNLPYETSLYKAYKNKLDDSVKNT